VAVSARGGARRRGALVTEVLCVLDRDGARGTTGYRSGVRGPGEHRL